MAENPLRYLARDNDDDYDRVDSDDSWEDDDDTRPSTTTSYRFGAPKRVTRTPKWRHEDDSKEGSRFKNQANNAANRPSTMLSDLKSFFLFLLLKRRTFTKRYAQRRFRAFESERGVRDELRNERVNANSGQRRVQK